MKEGGTIILNEKEVYPTPALLEQEEYPYEEIENLKDKFHIIKVDAMEEAKMAGNIKAANTVLIGMLAKELSIDVDIWKEVLKENVPSKAVDVNIVAFHRGYDI